MWRSRYLRGLDPAMAAIRPKKITVEQSSAQAQGTCTRWSTVILAV